MSEPARREPPILGFLTAVLAFGLALVFVGRARHCGAASTSAERQSEEGQAEPPRGREAEPPPSGEPEGHTNDEPGNDARRDGRRYTYTPLKDPRIWNLELTQAESQTRSLRNASDVLLNECLSTGFQVHWVSFELSLVMATGKIIDADGCVRPFTTQGANHAPAQGANPAPARGSKQEPRTRLGSMALSLLERAPLPTISPEFRSQIQEEWLRAFRKCVRWRSTGLCRMRSDGALEAEFEMILDLERCWSMLPPSPSCFAMAEMKRYSETRAKPPSTTPPKDTMPAVATEFGELALLAFPLKVFESVIRERSTDAERRELINSKFPLAVLQQCRVDWKDTSVPKVDHPHKWAVVVSP